MSTETIPRTLILGAGIFGTSTAYHLSLSTSASHITIIDRTPYPGPSASSRTKNPTGASHDINKIVRSDYTIPFYMALAKEALEAWSTWPLLKPFYHRSGWIDFVENGSDLLSSIRRNYSDARGRDPTRDMDFDEVRGIGGGVLRDVDVDGFQGAYWNRDAGWVEADKAVEAMLGDAVRWGVRYLHGEVKGIVMREGHEGVKGVQLTDGSVLECDRLVVATGAWTSMVLSTVEDELCLEEDMRIEKQVKAAGVCVAHYALDNEEYKKLEIMPVIIYGENGEMIPPPPSKLLKFTNAKSFMNTITTSSGHRISVPQLHTQNEVPDALKAETTRIITNRIMPAIVKDKRDVSFWRLCWDSITPSQHQLITRHPDERLHNLYLAAGGSFHSWKFLPTIGKYVVNMLQGRSNGEEMDRNWAWKHTGWSTGGERGAHEKLLPRRELRDLDDATIKSML